MHTILTKFGISSLLNLLATTPAGVFETLAGTTTTSAVAVIDNVVAVTAITSFVVGGKLRIDQEDMIVTKAWNGTSLQVPVLRGQNGSATAAHASGAPIIFELQSDLPQVSPPQQVVQYPYAMPFVTATYNASGAIAMPAQGSHGIAILNGTSTLTMTLANPTKDMDGSMLFLVANGKAAHTVTYSAGVGNGGGTMDVGTFNTTEATGCILMALNGFWVLIANGIGSSGTQVAGVVWA